jgi:hypothetical protein
MSFLTGTNVELLYSTYTAGTAVTAAAETNLNNTSAMGTQALLPGSFLTFPPTSRRSIRVVAKGIITTAASSQGNLTMTLRGTTAAGGVSGGTVLAATAVTALAASASNNFWRFEADIVFNDSSGAATMGGRGVGEFTSYKGLASPFTAEVWGGSAQPGTFTGVDQTSPLYFNMNATFSAAATNSIQLLQMFVYGLN